MSKKSIQLALASTFALSSLAAVPAKAEGDASALTFLQSVGCSQLPMGACDLLNANNAESILSTYHALLVRGVCGYENINAARAAVEQGIALDESGCRELLDALHAR